MPKSAQSKLLTNFTDDTLDIMRLCVNIFNTRAKAADISMRLTIKKTAYDCYGKKLSKEYRALHCTNRGQDLHVFWKYYDTLQTLTKEMHHSLVFCKVFKCDACGRNFATTIHTAIPSEKYYCASCYA